VLQSLKSGAWLQFCEYRFDNQPEVEQTTRKLLFERYDRKELTQFLKGKNRWKDEFNGILDQIDRFIAKKRL
jgi:hypothetical protein